MGVAGQRYSPAALLPGKGSRTHGTGGWVGPRAGLDGCGEPRPHRDSIPGPSSPLRFYPGPPPNIVAKINILAIEVGQKQIVQLFASPCNECAGMALWPRVFLRRFSPVVFTI